MCARHVRLSFPAIVSALAVCLSCTVGFGGVESSWVRFCGNPGCTPAHDNGGSSATGATAALAQTAEKTASHVLPAGCNCRSDKALSTRKTEKLEPIPAPEAEPAKQPTKVTEPRAAAPKHPIEIAEPRLLPWWEKTRQAGFFPTPIISVDLADQSDGATAATATKQAKTDPPEKESVVDPLAAKKRCFRDAVHMTVSDAGVVLVHD
jgi:hypothetical protein